MDLLIEADLSEDETNATEKTLERYRSSYDTFIKWQQTNGYNSIDEDALLAFFKNASQTYQSSTLKWQHSMLKKTLSHHHNIDIMPYTRLNDFLKNYSVRYERGKGKVFTPAEINRFMAQAPDKHYLAMKVSGKIS